MHNVTRKKKNCFLRKDSGIQVLRIIYFKKNKFVDKIFAQLHSTAIK